MAQHLWCRILLHYIDLENSQRIGGFQHQEYESMKHQMLIIFTEAKKYNNDLVYMIAVVSVNYLRVG
jgi:hypothetical protein